MSYWSKIWFVSGFISAVMAYSFWPYLWENSFYQLVSFSFLAYTRSLYLQSKGSWSLAVFVVWLTCVNSFLDEILFNPKEMNINEYIGFLLIILITVSQRKRWTR
jgi:uncharacterized membrane protein